MKDSVQVTIIATDFPGEENEHENEEDNQNVAVMNDDVLSDTSLQIPSVKELHICLPSPFTDYKAFRRFLEIFPNLNF